MKWYINKQYSFNNKKYISNFLNVLTSLAIAKEDVNYNEALQNALWYEKNLFWNWGDYTDPLTVILYLWPNYKIEYNASVMFKMKNSFFFPELFLSLSCLYAIIIIALVTSSIYGLMLQKALSECFALTLFMTCYLIFNDDVLSYHYSFNENSVSNNNLIVTGEEGLFFENQFQRRKNYPNSIFPRFVGKRPEPNPIAFSYFLNNSIVVDSLSWATKIVICFSSGVYFLIVSDYLKLYRLTSFEYIITLMFAILGHILLCSANDLLISYLSIELFSLASYILASFKKFSSYSVDSGLKYFVAGATSSSFFLLGSSFLYGESGGISFNYLELFFHRADILHPALVEWPNRGCWSNNKMEEHVEDFYSSRPFYIPNEASSPLIKTYRSYDWTVSTHEVRYKNLVEYKNPDWLFLAKLPQLKEYYHFYNIIKTVYPVKDSPITFKDILKKFYSNDTPFIFNIDSLAIITDYHNYQSIILHLIKDYLQKNNKDDWLMRYLYFKIFGNFSVLDFLTWDSVRVNGFIRSYCISCDSKQRDSIYYLRHPEAYAFVYNWYLYQPEIYSLKDIAIALIFFSLFIKLGLAPFHLWLIDVYEGSPTPSTFFFAVIGKISIFVLLYRISNLTFNYTGTDIYYLTLLASIISIFVGSFGGLQTKRIKTILAYSSINQMGYALLTFNSSYSLVALEALIFYIFIYVLSGLSSWCIITSLIIKEKIKTPKYNTELCDLTLLSLTNPALAIAFALILFSIAGLPPLAGFLAKIGILQVFLKTFFYEPKFDSKITTHLDCLNPFILNKPYQMEQAGPKLVHWTDFYSFHPSIILLSILIILCSVISTFYYIRIIKIMYFENALIGKLYYPIKNQKSLILSFLVFLTVFIFINPNVFYLIIHSVALLSWPKERSGDFFVYLDYKAPLQNLSIWFNIIKRHWKKEFYDFYNNDLYN